MATLFLIVCVTVANPATCTKYPISTEGLTMDLCKGVTGQSIARMHWQTFYADKEFAGWACAPVTAPEQGI